MKNKKPDSRPVFLNLLRIRQPVTALVSIAHRISGVLLFLLIPCSIWMLDRSLRGPEAYQQIVAAYDQPLIKLLALLITWAAAHHFFAGIRFLLLDIDIGIDLAAARRTAMVVNVLGVVSVLIAMVIIL